MPTTNMTLNTIKAINICDGGWKISLGMTPALEPGQALLLEVGAKCTVDITNGFTKPHMVLLLEALAVQDLWAQNVTCRALLVEFGGRASRTTWYYSLNNWGQSSISPQSRGITVLATSNERTLVSPVRPYCAPNPELRYGRRALTQLGNANPRIIYKYRMGTDPETGKSKELGDGRFLTIAYNRRHYFMNQYPKMNTPFVTNNAERGFDCTTYILVAYDVTANYGGGRGDDVAHCLSARETGVGGWKGTEAAAFFRANTSGEFVMWSHGHVVMVVDGVVHEFTTAGVYGYRATPVETYLTNNATTSYSVRALPGTNFVPVEKPAPPVKGKQPQTPQRQPGVGIGPAQPAGSLPPTSGGRSYVPSQPNAPSLTPTTQQPATGGTNLYTATGGVYGKKS